MAYSGQVLDHYENPRNVGKMNKDDPRVVNGTLSTVLNRIISTF